MECECRCGRSVQAEVENEQEGQPYRLCKPCAARLEARALRPLEWFWLASRHSPWKHLIHDDFYSRSGKAYQPEEEVVPQRGLMRAPTLEDSAKDATRLFTYAYTRHFLEPETVEAFLKLDPGSVRAALEPGLGERLPNLHNSYMACAIAADVLGPQAAGFVRRELDGATLDHFIGLSRAAAACLPSDEGLDWAFAFLDRLTSVERANVRNALSYFRNAKVIDWIERHEHEIEMALQWQKLAADSGLPWERAKAWIRRGRPLSLVALGALVEEMATWGVTTPRPVLSRAQVQEMIAELDAYALRDPARNPLGKIENIKSILLSK